MKLKTVIVSYVVVCILCSASSFAGVGLDFKAGLNLAKLRGSGIDHRKDSVKLFGVDLQNEMLPGIFCGVGLGIKINDYFVMQPEILVSLKGSKIIEEKDETEEIEAKAGYLEIPLLFKMEIPAGTFLPNFYAGPALDILLFADETDLKEGTKSVDFSIALGGGCDIVIGPGRAIVDIRYTIGLIDTRDPPVDDQEMKNSTLSFIVGYGFDFGE